jgi:transcriptional regulator with XRE-family HTH domain
MVVGAQLGRLREAKGISAVDAAYAIRATHSKISRMELDRVSFRPRDIEQLTSALYLDRRADVDSCYAVMERLCLQAAPATDTVTMLKEIRAKL